MSARANPPFVVRVAVVAVAYVLTAKAGIALATYAGVITPTWAPTGIALVALVLWGPRMWPAITLGAVLANVGIGIPAGAVAAMAAGNTLEALAGAWLLARAGFRPDLSRLRDVLSLGVLAGMVSTIISATIGVAALLAAGTLDAADTARAWLTWWLGDLGGDLLVAPLLFVIATHDRRRWFTRGRVLEGLVLTLVAVAVSTVVFRHVAGLVFLTFPVFVWAAIRFRQAGAAAISLVVTCVAVTLTARGLGPFEAGAETDGLLLAQLFGSVACLSSLILAVVTSEREQALAALRRSHVVLEEKVRERTAAMSSAQARIAAAHELAPIGTWEWDLAQNRVTWSDELYAIFGLDRAHHTPSFTDYLARVHPDDRGQVIATLRRARAEALPFALDERIVRPDGTYRALVTGAQVLTGEDGRPVRMLGICQDVTDARRADQALRESQERARRIVDAAGQAFISIDEHDVITDWNPAAEQLLGWSAEEALGRTLSETVIPASDRERHRLALARITESGATERASRRRAFEALHRHGHRIGVELEVSGFRTQDGWTFNAFLQDISERARAERRLMTENAVGRTLLEAGSLAEARPRLLEDIATGLGWDYGAWWSLDSPADVLRREAAWHSQAADARLLDRARTTTLATDAGVPGHVWRSGAMLALAELPPSPHAVLLSPPRASGPCRTIGLPIVSRGEVVAVIELVATEPLALGDDIDATMSRLAERIARFIERDRLEGRLQHLADHDPLTDLFNQRRFDEELARELLAARRYGTSGAVMALDLDNLKHVNDTLGHEAGNELIARVAEIVRERLRKTDIVARIGGDEFAAVLPRADESQACQIASELLDAIRDQALVETAGGACSTSASIGIAVFHDGAEHPSGDELLNEADMAMYDAKEAGRDRVHVFDPRSHGNVRRSWAEQIRSALAADRFTLYAQPIQALRPGRGRRHELLLRMVGPDDELIAPATFMAAAERLDLVQELDHWVVRHAIALLSDSDHDDVDCFYVNLSARSINSTELLAIIAGELAQSGADPGRLIFEVTETAAIVDVQRARRFVSALHDLGCGFALDDFGTGFASFYNLKHLPFDELKIDGEFVETLTTNPVNQLIVRSIVAIARGLGKRTVAEWVGDDATLELLRSYGVDYAQGFHIGRPEPVERVASVRPWARPTA